MFINKSSSPTGKMLQLVGTLMNIQEWGGGVCCVYSTISMGYFFMKTFVCPFCKFCYGVLDILCDNQFFCSKFEI